MAIGGAGGRGSRGSRGSRGGRGRKIQCPMPHAQCPIPKVNFVIKLGWRSHNLVEFDV
ncbi:MAG: hypothetical protein ACRAVC_05085 [Trichormus sp.]